MGHKTVASNRPAGVWSTEGHDGASAQRMSVDAPARTDEASRGTVSSLAYRAKDPAHNPRKHQRGSPSLGDIDIEEQAESTGERHIKRISGDSGYGSDTQRIRCEEGIYSYDRCTEPAQSPLHSSKGLRRVKGTATLRPKIDIPSLSDSSNDSGDESSVESSVFSIPSSPIEPCEPDRDDPLAPHFDAVVANVLERFRHWQVRQRGGQGGRSQARRPSSNTTDSGRSSRKRWHSELPEHPASDEEVLPAPGFKRPKVPAPPTRTLACPFWKKNPDNHRQCYKKVLSKIKYVKSHLYRFHPAPIACPCCGAEFQSEEVRDEHLRARRCEVVERGDIAGHEGLTAERMRQVSRRADPRLSEEEQWFVIWDIIFPNTPRPSSAYIDGVLSEDVCNFHEFFSNSGNDIILHYFSLQDPDFARGDRAALYDRFVRDRVLERIYEQWATGRGLRRPHDADADADDFTPPQSIPTESELPSRASSAHGNPPQTSPRDIQPVPESALDFAGHGFDEADFGGEDDSYDSYTQSLFDDLAGMFPGADYR
ncbi:hypothetical protein LX32DRAFT_163003 [Colletotrichum zoysiae]|uniref:C2H2-type domain-containing protein n=1 Tax=Colletotrichum zoysiae TaxID=1216348 RepID=A0AAD9LYX0_9PEZI|nr:hypothetical protein LX32DRAFT_163003 [Colletotrichum zoysiae]